MGRILAQSRPECLCNTEYETIFIRYIEVWTQQFSTLYRMLYNVLYTVQYPHRKNTCEKTFYDKKVQRFYTVKYNLVKPANIRKEQFLIRGDFSYFQLPFMIGDIKKFIFFP